MMMKVNELNSQAQLCLMLMYGIHFLEALSSDEDEVDENNTSYLDGVKNFATKKASQLGFEMSAEIRVRVFFDV